MQPSLDYASRSTPARPNDDLFWVGVLALGLPVGLLTRFVIGATAPAAVLLQGAGLVWLAALGLRAAGWRGAWAVAAAWAVLLWVPLGAQVVRRLHHWATIGMDAADGSGSPMAFVFGFALEWAVFGPLTALLAWLAWARLWRARRPGG